MASEQPLGREERPGGETEALKKSLAGDYDNLTAMRRREAAALRCEPLLSGLRDPQFGQLPPTRGPQTFGLSGTEIAAHGQDLVESGWQRWEVVAVLVDPRRAAA